MENKLYYLSHPYTSNGEKYSNILHSRMIANNLAKNLDIVTINPLDIVPVETDEESRALEICKILLKQCEVLILSGDWKYSKGCQLELSWAIEDKKPVFLYKDGELIGFEVDR